MSAQTASHESIAALRRAVALDPRGWLALGDRLLASGDAAGADAAYVEHVRHASKDPALLRAGAALAQNRIPEAEALLRAHLQRAPTDVAAIRMFAELAARLGRLEEAEHLLARALELAPSFHAARLHYALVLNRGNKPTDALAQIERLLRVDPNNPGYRNLHAVVLCRIGEYTRALEIYARLLRQYPAQTKIWMSYGHALKTEGRQDEAIAAYRRCIALDPAFGEAWWSLANLKTLRFDENDLATMRRQLENASLPVEHRFHLEFALGKALEDAGEHAESFAHYERGNRHRRETAYYNPEDNAARVRLIKRTYTREFFARTRRQRQRGERPDLHRRHAARGLDADRADPLQPLRRRRDDGAAGDHRDHARDAPFARHRAIAALPRSAGGAGSGTAARTRRGLSRTHAHPPQVRRAALHRQDAEQLRAHRPDPPGPAEREDHRRAPPSAGVLLLQLQAALRARPELQLRRSTTSAATTATTSS